MTSRVIKKQLFALSALCLSMLLTGCEVGGLSAGGPGTGGTGPIIITTSSENILTMDKIVRPDADASNPPAIDEDPSKDITYNVTTLNSSIKHQVCKDFERSISLIKDNSDNNAQDNPQSSNFVNVTNLSLTRDNPILVQVTVKNITDTNQMEVRGDCSAFSLLTNNLLTIDKPVLECSKPSENLLFLPKQTHIYTANISNLLTQPEGTYRLSYVNKISDNSKSNATPFECDTFIELDIKKQADK